MVRCPRCQSLNVRASKAGFVDCNLYDFGCLDCRLFEHRRDDAADFAAWYARWDRPDPEPVKAS